MSWRDRASWSQARQRGQASRELRRTVVQVPGVGWRERWNEEWRPQSSLKWTVFADDHWSLLIHAGPGSRYASVLIIYLPEGDFKPSRVDAEAKDGCFRSVTVQHCARLALRLETPEDAVRHMAGAHMCALLLCALRAGHAHGPVEDGVLHLSGNDNHSLTIFMCFHAYRDAGP